jgi:succinoglycan biosynthesis transport protein ExoP
MTEQRHAHASDLERFLRILRRRRLVIVLSFIGVIFAALALSLSQEKKYSATSQLLFRDPAIDRTLFKTYPPPTADAATLRATNERLVSLPAVAQRTAARLGRPLTAAYIRGEISVATEGQADLVSVTATDHNPRLAATLANTFAAEYINWRRDADRVAIARAQKRIRLRMSQVQSELNRKTLQRRLDDLGIIQALQTGRAELVQTAKPPTSPSSPRPVRNGILGGMMGLFLGVSLAFLFDRLDRRMKEPRELEETYRFPVLGAVPESKALRDTASMRDGELQLGSEGESFRKLRARLRYFNVDRDIRSIVVTSAAAEEGKTVVASHLALAAAIGGQTRTLLLEADLRKPSLSARFELAPMPGLAELLTHEIGVPEVVQRIPVASGMNGQSTKLDVIVAGAIPPNPAELMESRKMGDLVDQLSGMYDMVVIDTPPVSVVSDAMPLVLLVSGVLVVSWMGRTTRDAAMHLRHELESLNAPTLGVVVNRVRAGTDAYYGYPYYGVEQVAVTRLKDKEPV